MNYKIKIEYITGNSFGSEMAYDEVGYIWSTLELAQKALENIKKHYEYNESLNSYEFRKMTKEDEKEYNNSFSNEDWYSNDEFTITGNQYLKIPNYDGSEMVKIYAFWFGYFERLVKAEIVIDIDLENHKNIFIP